MITSSGAGSAGELESAVERLSRLVLSAQSLADRMSSGPDGSSERDERVVRLQRGVTLGQRGLATALLHAGLDRRTGERRRLPAGGVPAPRRPSSEAH